MENLNFLPKSLQNVKIHKNLNKNKSLKKNSLSFSHDKAKNFNSYQEMFKENIIHPSKIILPQINKDLPKEFFNDLENCNKKEKFKEKYFRFNNFKKILRPPKPKKHIQIEKHEMYPNIDDIKEFEREIINKHKDLFKNYEELEIFQRGVLKEPTNNSEDVFTTKKFRDSEIILHNIIDYEQFIKEFRQKNKLTDVKKRSVIDDAFNMDLEFYKDFDEKLKRRKKFRLSDIKIAEIEKIPSNNVNSFFSISNEGKSLKNAKSSILNKNGNDSKYSIKNIYHKDAGFKIEIDYSDSDKDKSIEIEF